ncbi:S-layer homology domain-containing protein [Vallitalea okinawensis]|uniref:S-layer homology domain-containing protein n=1 Tax=Vallitalea okinawensis TaxID=2078660 RepID=UPI000CFAE09A|nr:S-layer homology domain-containing protein [Vallitalea okinawensis]
MKGLKKIISLLLVVALTLSFFPVETLAKDKDYYRTEKWFSDLDEDHWAYDYVIQMVERDIIAGYSDGRFKPSKEVSRAEFAKMMVLTLDLPLIKPDNPSFEDISYKDWEYPYVETAKYYLTGFRTNNGDYFKPDIYAVREDMAVALVKALDINPEETDLDILDEYKDEDYISSNLRHYVATIIDEGIMVGDDDKYFSPQGSLTRAEAAVLLSRLIDEDKVTYDDEKVTYDEEDLELSTEREAPYLEYAVTDDGVVLEWDEVSSRGFKYYKVVVSKYNKTPEYPDDGYLVCLENVRNNRYVVKPYAKYNDSDFGDKIQPGDSYYISITAVYKDETITGNTIYVEVPDEEYEDD